MGFKRPRKNKRDSEVCVQTYVQTPVQPEARLVDPANKSGCQIW